MLVNILYCTGQPHNREASAGPESPSWQGWEIQWHGQMPTSLLKSSPPQEAFPDQPAPSRPLLYFLWDISPPPNMTTPVYPAAHLVPYARAVGLVLCGLPGMQSSTWQIVGCSIKTHHTNV